MARRALWLVVLAMLLPAQSASAQGAGRVVLVTVDGTTLGDWADLPAFRSIVDEGAVALLSTRTSCRCEDPVAAREAAYRSFATVGDRTIGDRLRRASIAATALGDANGGNVRDVGAAHAAATSGGMLEIEPGNLVPVATAPITTGRDDPGAPGGRRTDFVQVRARLDTALAWARFVVVDLGDTERADRLLWRDPAARRSWVDLALRDADRFLAGLRSSLRPEDLLIVASIATPLGRREEGIRLGAVAATGLGRGLLKTETTTRAGLVTLADLGATVADRLGIEVPRRARGRAAVVEAGAAAPAALRELERDVILAHRSRLPAVRAWMWPAAALIAVAFTLVVAGRGRRPGIERWPRHSRDVVATGLVAVALAPAALLLAPMLAVSVAGVGWLSLALASVAALGLHLALGHERALVAGLLTTSVVALADLLTGSTLATRSAIGPEIASGLRVAGTSDAILAVLIAAPATAAGLALDRAHNRGRIAGRTAALLLLGVVAAAAPGLGGRIAAPIAGVPFVALFAWFAAGRTRVTARNVHAIAIASVLTTALVAAAHLWHKPPPAPGGAIGRWLGGFAAAWLATLVAGAAAAGLLLLRRRSLAARAFWGRPHLRLTLTLISGAGAVLLFAGSGGVEAAATISALAAPAFFLPFLAPD